MPFRVQAELADLEQLKGKLTLLKGTLQKRVLHAGMRKATSIVSKDAKRRARRRTGQLRKSLGTKVKTYPSGVVVGVVEPRDGFRIMAAVGRSGKAKAIDPRFYAHLIEGGVKPHAVGGGSSLRKKRQSGRLHPGHAADPFLQPAAASNETQIVAAFDAEIDKAVAKL